jgi:hypothetical protein
VNNRSPKKAPQEGTCKQGWVHICMRGNGPYKKGKLLGRRLLTRSSIRWGCAGFTINAMNGMLVLGPLRHRRASRKLNRSTMERLHLGKIVDEEGRGHQLEEHRGPVRAPPELARADVHGSSRTLCAM